MGTSNLLDADFKTLVKRILNELIENFNRIKKGLVRKEGYTD